MNGLELAVACVAVATLAALVVLGIRATAVPAADEDFDWEREELNRLNERRARYGLPDASAGGTVGLALSGGGIRSATFNLGLIRSLERAGLMPRIDYLSTVSGGGYVGSMFCSLFVPRSKRGRSIGEAERERRVAAAEALALERSGAVAAPTPPPGRPLSSEQGAAALEHLRQNGRYLVPGSADLLRLLLLVTRNLLSVHFVIGLTLVTGFVLVKAVQLTLIAWEPAARVVEAADAALAARGADPFFWPTLWLNGYPLHHWLVGSWLLYLAAFPAVLAVLFGASYWLTQRRGAPRSRLLRIVWNTAVWSFVIAAGLGALLMAGSLAPGMNGAGALGLVLGGGAVLAVLLYALAELVDWMRSRRAPGSPEMQEDRVRNLLTDGMQRCAAVALWLILFGAIDTVASTLYLRQNELAIRLAATGGVVAVAIPLLRWLVQRAMAGSGGGRIGSFLTRYMRLLSLVVGLAFAGVIAVLWSTVADALVWHGGPIGSTAYWAGGDVLARLWGLAALLATASLVVWFSPAFVNLSSYANFYASRLRVAYLGATNPDRRDAKHGGHDRRDFRRDDMRLEDYYEADGAPLHLINIAVNDTDSSSSNLTRLDRHAKPFTISPVGFLYPGQTATKLLQRSFKQDNMPLSLWMSVSGAAFSTGIGYLGGAGFSLIAGLVNMRLGYWWQPGSGGRSWRRGVQRMLWRELARKFPGTDGDRWYLSDGGHFENTGVYELVRRRVPVIIMADCGADPGYRFEDLTRLMRLIRIDFEAELTILQDEELDLVLGPGTPLRRVFASLKGLGLCDTGSAPQMGPYAALGRIDYPATADNPHPSPSTLILMKPRICGGEMPDMLAYWRANPAFPQQTTLDQLYDEAQWECYFRLGALIGERLFADSSGEYWRPRDLSPAPFQQAGDRATGDAGSREAATASGK
jgi:hypothetical protein